MSQLSTLQYWKQSEEQPERGGTIAGPIAWSLWLLPPKPCSARSHVARDLPTSPPAPVIGDLQGKKQFGVSPGLEGKQSNYGGTGGLS